MDDRPSNRPTALDGILADAERLGFAMSCEDRTGSLLATLAASKPDSLFLELGTGVGAGAAWLLSGMDAASRLVTVEADPAVQEVAACHLGTDPRVTFSVADAAEWLDTYSGPRFAFAFVDCRPGKFHHLGNLLDVLEPGALYVVDDLLPQDTWPEDHQQHVDEFLREIPAVSRLLTTSLRWASGLLIGARG